MITGQDKSYTAEVVLGYETDTGDTTGQILRQATVRYDKDAICKAVEGFRGPQLQIPPMYSAVKIGGKRLYKLAREGQTVERKPRCVEIMGIKVSAHRPESNTFTIDVTCSKGTYIRSLCTDIGKALGTCATMGTLLRTRSGAFSLDSAVKLAKLREAAECGSLNNLLLTPEEVLPFPRAYVRPEGFLLAKNGNPVPVDMVDFENTGASGKQPRVMLPVLSKMNKQADVSCCNSKFWLYGACEMIGLFATERTCECIVAETTASENPTVSGKLEKHTVNPDASQRKLRPEVML